MITFIARRTLEAIPTLLIVILIIFFLLNVMPGDVALLKGSARSGSNPELIEHIREKWGLEDPIPMRFGRYLWNLLKGNLGYSIMKNAKVASLIQERIAPTFKLVAMGLSFAILVGVIAGFIGALNMGSFIDTGITTGAIFGKSFPKFWLGLLLMYIIGVKLGWLPTMGYGEGDLAHLILPAFTLGIPHAALLARITRGAVLDLIHEDYIRTARSKGLSESVVRLKHMFRNAIPPVITVIGLQFGALLAGTVVIEKVFILPGIGTLLIDSIYARDVQVIQGIVLLLATSFIVINLLVDISYGFIDPRIRYE